MACKLWGELLHAYQDGMLSPSERTSMEAHLRTCADCRAEWVLLQGVVRALREEPLIGPPSGFTAKVMARVPVRSKPWAFNWRAFLYIGLYLALMAGTLWGMAAFGPRIGDAYEDGIFDAVEWGTVFGEDFGDWVYDAVTSGQYGRMLLVALGLLLGWVLYEIGEISYVDPAPRGGKIGWALPGR